MRYVPRERLPRPAAGPAPPSPSPGRARGLGARLSPSIPEPVRGGARGRGRGSKAVAPRLEPRRPKGTRRAPLAGRRTWGRRPGGLGRVGTWTPRSVFRGSAPHGRGLGGRRGGVSGGRRGPGDVALGARLVPPGPPGPGPALPGEPGPDRAQALRPEFPEPRPGARRPGWPVRPPGRPAARTRQCGPAPPPSPRGQSAPAAGLFKKRRPGAAESAGGSLRHVNTHHKGRGAGPSPAGSSRRPAAAPDVPAAASLAARAGDLGRAGRWERGSRPRGSGGAPRPAPCTPINTSRDPSASPASLDVCPPDCKAAGAPEAAGPELGSRRAPGGAARPGPRASGWFSSPFC